MLLLQASALEEANAGPRRARPLTQALAIAPDEPLLLNFLGYGKLERGEDLDAAEAMIRKASALAPDDASITNSLGWAIYKRGRTDEAIAIADAGREGRPDAGGNPRTSRRRALFTAGRRFEARFAWPAALVTAEDDAPARLKAKIDTGLTPATAAP